MTSSQGFPRGPAIEAIPGPAKEYTMSDDFSRFAILAAPVADTPIPPELITGLELACNRGPLGHGESRSIGRVPEGYSLTPTLAALRAKLKPIGLDVTPSMAGDGILVHRPRTAHFG